MKETKTVSIKIPPKEPPRIDFHLEVDDEGVLSLMCSTPYTRGDGDSDWNLLEISYDESTGRLTMRRCAGISDDPLLVEPGEADDRLHEDGDPR